MGFYNYWFGCGACEEIVEIFERIFSTWDGKRFLLIRIEIEEGAGVDCGSGCGCGSGSEQ